MKGDELLKETQQLGGRSNIVVVPIAKEVVDRLGTDPGRQNLLLYGSQGRRDFRRQMGQVCGTRGDEDRH